MNIPSKHLYGQLNTLSVTAAQTSNNIQVFWGVEGGPTLNSVGFGGTRWGGEKGEINFVFLNSVHINIFIKTKKEKGAWGGKEIGEWERVGPSQFHLTKKCELISW